jgi:hypothetical protein
LPDLAEDKMHGLFAVVVGYLVEAAAWRKLDPWLVDRPVAGRIFLLQALFLPPLAFLIHVAIYYPYFASPLRSLPGPRVS